MGWFDRPEFGPNVGLVDEIYRQYVDDPNSVSEAWREFFAEHAEDGEDRQDRQDGQEDQREPLFHGPQPFWGCTLGMGGDAASRARAGVRRYPDLACRGKYVKRTTMRV